MSAGERHTCGVRATGEIACWGKNDFGQTFEPDGQFLNVDVGYNYACGVRVTGKIECWGDN